MHNGHFATGALRENLHGADAGWLVENSVTAATLHEFLGPTFNSILPDEVK
jgi:hypothetical protein